jgi:CHAD domain-containing protein
MKQGKRNYGLKYWMAKAGTEYAQARTSPNPIVIHDLRVALRRVRTLASYLALAHPSPALETIQSLSKPLFKDLAKLRNNQVLQERLKQLRSKKDPAAVKLLKILESGETKFRGNIREILPRFEILKWRKLTRLISQPEHIGKTSRKIYVKLALQQLERTEKLHGKVLLKPSLKNYHRVRIAFKKFRYLLENLLPADYRLNAKTLMAIQDVLGSYHDFEFLRKFIQKQRRHLSATNRHQCERSILKEQKRSLRIYHALMSGQKRLWRAWRKGLLSASSSAASASKTIPKSRSVHK